MNLLGLKTCFLLGHSFSSFLPSFLTVNFVRVLNSLVRVFVAYILTSIAGLVILFSYDRNFGGFLDDILLNYSIHKYEESLQKGLFTETDLAFTVSLNSK